MMDNTHLLDRQLVDKREINGWYSFAFASEGYGVLALGIFFPIVLEGLASAVAVESHDHSKKCDLSFGYDCSVKIGFFYIPTTSVFFYSTTLAVIIQFFLFISLSSLADYGLYRKNMLMFFGYVTAFLGLLTVFVTQDSHWWLAFLIYILTTITFGACFV